MLSHSGISVEAIAGGGIEGVFRVGNTNILSTPSRDFKYLIEAREFKFSIPKRDYTIKING